MRITHVEIKNSFHPLNQYGGIIFVEIIDKEEHQISSKEGGIVTYEGN